MMYRCPKCNGLDLSIAYEAVGKLITVTSPSGARYGVVEIDPEAEANFHAGSVTVCNSYECEHTGTAQDFCYPEL